MGSPTFGKNVLEKLIEEFNVVLVVTKPDSYTKGGRVIIEQPVKILAKEKNIKIFQPENIKEDCSLMKQYDFDFIVTAAYGQFIPKAVLDLPKIETLNVHGSMLPKYRGGAPIQRAILNGDEYLGVSVMRTVSKMDAGCVYHQTLIKLNDDDTTETMMDKLSIEGAKDICDVIEKMYKDKDSVKGIEQDPNEVSFAYNITKDEELIDFNNDAYSIFNKVRAFNPNPVAKMQFGSNQYKIYKAKVAQDNSDALPGTILDNKKRLLIKCGTNAIEILSIQPSGKQIMDIQSFLNGYRSKFNVGEKIS